MKKPIEIANRVAALLSRKDGRPGILMDICKQVAEGLKAEVASLYVSERDSYRLVANFGFESVHVGKLEIEKGLGLIHHIATTARALCLREATSHPAFYYVKGIGEEKYHGFAGVPILRRGKAIGVLDVQFRREHDCTLEDVALLETVAQQISDTVYARLKKKTAPRRVKMRVTGRGVVPGIFAGKVVRRLLIEETMAADEEGAGQGYEREKRRLHEAHRRTQQYFDSLRGQTTNHEASTILAAHLTMLNDPMLLRKEDDLLKKNCSAEQAVALAVREIAKAFEGISDPYIRQRSMDVLDVGRRLYHMLTQSDEQGPGSEGPQVYLARHPSATMLIEGGTARFGALVLVEESLYGHVIILAKSMGVPTVVITSQQLKALEDADHLLVDGELGTLYIDPSEILVENYRKSHAEENLPQEDLGPCRTADGHAILLGMNAAFPREVQNLPPWVQEVGLFRTEFIYFLSDHIPTESEQAAQYVKIFQAAGNRPVTLRILDVGGDKCPPAMQFLHEDNPILGNRSIRFLLKRSDLFFPQLKAMLRAQHETQGNLRILIPMVSIYEEVSRIRDHLAKVLRDFRKEDLRLKAPELGVMVEVPSAVGLIGKLARLVDFYSVGTNDLIQYYMASDRNNSRVSYLCRWHHPALLMLLSEISRACRRANREVNICGEMAGEMWGSLVLLGLGFRRLSMDRKTLARHHRLFKHVDSEKLKTLVERLMACETSLELLEHLHLHLEHWRSLPKDLKELLETELSKMLSPEL